MNATPLLTDEYLYAWFMAHRFAWVGSAGDPDACPIVQACASTYGLVVCVDEMSIIDAAPSTEGCHETWPVTDIQGRFVERLDARYGVQEVTGHAACLVLEEVGRLDMLNVMEDA